LIETNGGLKSSVSGTRVEELRPVSNTPTLERRKSAAQNLVMTNKGTVSDKEVAQDVLGRMPDDASLNEIVQELEFVATVRQSLSEFDNNKDSISIEKVEPKPASWVVTIGRKRKGRQKRKQVTH
jgi:hypothetical protein